MNYCGLTVGRGRGAIGMIDIGGIVVVRRPGQDDETVMMVMHEMRYE
jgi:hypothetical protein